jgi:adenine-specific DNA-methyltransferase
MKYPVKSIKHGADKRAHIPSGEEAGYEAGSKRVKDAPDQAHFPVNPIVQRGQDPELNWMDKYKTAELRIPIRSLYRHEHIAPETLVKGLYRIVATENKDQPDLFSVNALFGNALDHEELDKVSDYYTHSDGWSNRLVQGDSLLTMTSLLEREGMAGQVQCIYIDPPYGIKYGSNWQIKLNNRTVTDGQDDSLSGEPEQIKAFRDTWELGIHSYLSYLRDRLLVAKQLLHDSGSCFVQISDENVHLVRCLMDEVFGSGNFVGLIPFVTTSSQTSGQIGSVAALLGLWGDFLPPVARMCERSGAACC